MTNDLEMAERILQCALQLAEQRGWDAVHLHDVAQAMGIGLADVHRHYSQKDDLAEAWFDLADRELLRAAEAPDWRSLSVRERLSRAIAAWLQALAQRKSSSVAMLRYKLQPDHLHLQALGLMRLSRTVQWIREAAGLPAVALRRELEELALTAIFVGTVLRWLGDDSPDMSRTLAWLDRQLARAEWVALRWP